MLTGKIYYKALRGFFSLIILLCAVWQLRFALQEQKDFNAENGNKSLTESRDAGILTYRAKQKHLLEADMVTAKSLLQKALLDNPYYIPGWLALAELKNDLGEKQSAYAILTYVGELSQGLKRWRWDKALVAYQLGKFELLPGELSYIVREIPGKSRQDALQLAFTLWQDPNELLRNIGPENILHLLEYSVARNLAKDALFFWKVLERDADIPPENTILVLLEMLLRNGETHEAGTIWRTHFDPHQLLFNGDFSQPFLQRAFGWRVIKDSDIEQDFQQSSVGNTGRSVHYRFKGWSNLDFHHLFQITPLEGGAKYKLSAEWKSQGLTTDQRPFLEVYGYKCKATPVKSPMVDADQDWTDLEVFFSLPQECGAAVVRLRRTESNHIDSKMEGQLWLRKIAVTKVGENFSEADSTN